MTETRLCCQGWACRALRLDLSNSLLGMAAVLGGLASLMTSLRLGSAFLFASWAAAALLGMPSAGRVRPHLALDPLQTLLPCIVSCSAELFVLIAQFAIVSCCSTDICRGMICAILVSAP